MVIGLANLTLSRYWSACVCSVFACCLAVLVRTAVAQTTQGLISGRVADVYTGKPTGQAQISYENQETGVSGRVQADVSGQYIVPLLSPGTYRIRVTAEQYQAQEVHQIIVPVAGRLEISFRLRPLTDIWEAGQYRTLIPPNSEAVVPFYGPDVDTSRSGSFEAVRGLTSRLESTVSQVIDRRELNGLPLAGRDAYVLLLAEPGVTASTSTTRGLGLSVNGQRPTASNFLLDGVENNNYLITGPLTTVAPEALGEYRVSTNNFSAEYGRTSGFVANAISRSGTNQWHGMAYFYGNNDVLNANDFQRNFQGVSRTPVRQSQPGFFVGGPARRNVLFVSGSFDYLRYRSRETPQTILLPSTQFSRYSPPGTLARQILAQYPPLPVAADDLPTAAITIAPPSRLDLNRFLALPRADYVSPSARHRISGRVVVSRLERPNFLWTPYPDFVSALNNNAFNVAVAATTSFSARLTNEAKIGVGSDHLQFDRPHPEVPTLATGDGTVLPGSPALYGFRNRTQTGEFLDNVLFSRGSHLWKFGGGVLLRNISGYLTAAAGGLYQFRDVPISFGTDRPSFFTAPVSRTALMQGRQVLPVFDREYRSRQFFLFAQDSFRVTSKLVLNYGLRYEYFEAPVNVGSVKDAQIQLGAGNSLPERLAGAQMVIPSSADQQLYNADLNDLAVRVGFSWTPRPNPSTVFRGSYGIFYDRPFDNLWLNLRNNDVDIRQYQLSEGVNYLQPVAQTLASVSSPNISFLSDLTTYQPGIRTGYVQSWFFGVQHQFTDAFNMEVNTLGALGRKLIATDVINRAFSLPAIPALPQNPARYFNPQLGPIHYRSGQGASDYTAMTVVGRYRSSRAQFQAAYTWSHSIDNQSDPLTGGFFGLDITALSAGTVQSVQSAFSRQFDSRGDRGNSDFDQRHNLVFFSAWDIPSALTSSRLAPVFRSWRISSLAAVRSGLPYTVRAPSDITGASETILNNRADLTATGREAADANVPAGKVLLNSNAFRQPTRGTVGNVGRNSFRGPGFFNVDLSVSRTFAMPGFGESGRLTLRADAFNFLNHANLGNPDALIGSPTFGVARYGRREESAGFPLLIPFAETARQVQLMLRIQF